jgi:uncharacterized membrane protein
LPTVILQTVLLPTIILSTVLLPTFILLTWNITNTTKGRFCNILVYNMSFYRKSTSLHSEICRSTK